MAAGTLSVTNNSKAVVGVGTTFTAFKAGDFLTLVVGQVPYTVAIASIESATALTLVLPFDGPTATGLAWDGVKRDTMSLATMGVTVQAQKALRLMIADENNWRAIFGEEEEISVTLPNGQVVQGMSWGYLSKLLKDVDPVELQAIADQTITAKNQAQGFRNEAEGFKNTANTAKDAAVAAKTAAETAQGKAKTAKTAAESAKTAAETAKSQAVTAKDQAKGFRDEAEGFANSADASQKVPYAGVTLPAPTGVRDLLKRLRDSVKGGFWRVDDVTQFPAGEMAPFRYSPGVFGGAGDTFFAINVDYQTSRVKVYSGNNAAINGSSEDVSAIELAKLGVNGDVAIEDGGTGASDDQGARKNLQAMHDRQETLVSEDLNDLQGDKAGFYYTGKSAYATPGRNYPAQEAGCLLVQRSGANDPKSCVQTYTAYRKGRRWIRWLDNAATGIWSTWYELYNAGSSPEYNAYVRAKSGDRIVEMFVGGTDVGIRNSTSQKVLQLRDNGELSYDNKLIAYNGLESGAIFNLKVPELALHTRSVVIDLPSGKHFKMLNQGDSSHSATFSLWGNGADRKTILEWSLDNGPGWMFYAQYNPDGTKQMNVNGTVNCTTVNQSSDRDLKDNIKPIENARAGLAKMGGYTYTLKKDGMPYAGVIAQEVIDVVPEAVSTFEDYEYLAGPTKDGEALVGRQRFFQVDYGAIAAYAVQVCKEQEEELVSLRSELEELKAAVAALTKA